MRGMLIAGGRDKSVWIEDASQKVLSDSFIAEFAEHGPHEHFNDALIHLGGMGIVNAVLLEVVPEFLLGSIQKVEPLPADCITKLAAGDFSGAMAHISEGRDPFFYELTFDPFRGIDHEVAQLAYVYSGSGTAKALTEPVNQDPLDIICGGVAHSLSESQLHDIDDAEEDEEDGDLLDLGKLVLEKIAEEEHSNPDAGWPFKRMLKTWEPRTIGPFRVNTYNAAFAIPLEHLPRALEIGFEIAPNFKRRFVYTVRFATKSPAAMSFLRWDRCAIFNVDGLERKYSKSPHNAAKAFVAELAAEGIPYSMHWGKDAPSDEGKITADFGSAITGWKAMRDAILSSRIQRRFKSPALKDWGLV